MNVSGSGPKGIWILLLLSGFASATDWANSGSNNTNMGNVGIGINPPTVKLHVEADYGPGGTGQAGSYPANGTVHFISWADDGPATETGVSLFRMSAGRINTYDPNASKAIVFEVATDDKRVFGIRGNGYVGIGTSAPGVPLDVRGRALITGETVGQEALVVTQAASSGPVFNARQGSNSRFLVDFDGKVGIGSAAIGGGELNALFKVASGSNSNNGSYPTQNVVSFESWAPDGPAVDNDVTLFRFNAARISSTDPNAAKAKVFEVALDDKRAFVVRGNGNIGIGISNPTRKLDIDGGIKATGDIEVANVVTRNWNIRTPDYVFEKDYALKPLEEVDAFVKRNKHLPEIPSAKELEGKGMNLAEMNLLLLKKVEELTLHAIRQEKEMKRQAEEISRLKNFR